MNIGGAIGFVLLASVKFMIGPPVGFEAGLNFWQTVFGMCLGGWLGVLTFYYTAHWFMERARRRRFKKVARLKAQGKPNPVLIFTRRNKRIVRIKQKLGFYGVVFIALPFASLPIEGIICAKFFKHDKRLIPMLILSVVIWAFLLTVFYDSFYADVRALFT